MNVRTRTVTLCVRFHKYCDLKTWKCSFCRSHKNLRIIFFEEVDLDFWTDLQKYVPLSSQNLCCSQNNLFTFLSTQHSSMQMSKIRTSICHSSAAFEAQISIQSKTQHTITQRNVPLQNQFYWAATDKWMQFWHETCF